MALQEKQSSEHHPSGVPVARVPRRRFARRIVFALTVCGFAVTALACYLSVRAWRHANRALDAASGLTDGGYVEQADVVLAGYDDMRAQSRPLEAVWARATDSRASEIRARLEDKRKQTQAARPRRPTFTPTLHSHQWAQRQQLNDQDVDLAAWCRAIEHYPAVTRPLAHEFAVSWDAHYKAWNDIRDAGLKDTRNGLTLLGDSALADLEEKPQILVKLIRATAP